MYVEKSLEKYRENRDTAKSGNTKKKQAREIFKMSRAAHTAHWNCSSPKNAILIHQKIENFNGKFCIMKIPSILKIIQNFNHECSK